ncbi:VOC family protein [Pontimicrobium aquaticum]|uniref:Glyoxalase n=1 Tax=Pontimicrobium aquaticum TaxID=2565367 RepID=A0A4U0F0T7_9FLAO|nr:VOC family protein [Pontimicrobium aquaticum]TJY37344.1 glyoxalase [Pontimicrobium aquaticum]
MYIKMTSLPVSDPIKAHNFYTEIIGLKSHTFMPEAQLAIVTSNDCKTTILLEPKGDGFYHTFQKTAYDQGLPIVILGSENVQADYERLIDLGVNFKQKPTKTDWGIVAMFEDTFGNYIQIHQD